MFCLEPNPLRIYVQSLHVRVFVCASLFSSSLHVFTFSDFYSFIYFVTSRQCDHSVLEGRAAKQNSWCLNAMADNSVCCVRKWDV